MNRLLETFIYSVSFVVGTILCLQAERKNEVEFECIGVSNVTVLMKAAAASTEQFIFNHAVTSAEYTALIGGTDVAILNFTINVNDSSGSDGSINSVRVSSIFTDDANYNMQLMHQSDPNVRINIVVQANQPPTSDALITNNLKQHYAVKTCSNSYRPDNLDVRITIFILGGQPQISNTGVYSTILEFSITNDT